MPLNLRTLGVRSLTAFFFVVVFLGSVCWNYLSFIVFFTFLGLAGLGEFLVIAESSGSKPFRKAAFASAIIICLAFVDQEYLSGQTYLSQHVLVILPLIFLIAALFRKEGPVMQDLFLSAGGVLYATLPFCLLHRVVINSGLNYEPGLLLFGVFLIWINDTFAYLGGSLFGKNKMIPRISPGKTWEGTVTGLVFSFLCSLFLRPFLLPESSGLVWLIAGLIIPILATVGDLAQSMLKRQAGVKDSGNLMPGHGGILDRFDSLIFVSPYLYLLSL
jgi:phosphatidate cytidylyltransferase